MRNQENRITKHHPDQDNFSPTDSWNVRPRVLTYVREGRNLHAVEISPSETTGICWVTIRGVTPLIIIANIYRPPQKAEGGPVISTLKVWRAPANYLVAGDFNTRNPLWDTRAAESRKADELADWILLNSLILVSPSNLSTHSRGSTLDLVFSIIPGTQWNIEEDLHTTSDYETLLSLVPCSGYRITTTRKIYKLSLEAIPRFAVGVKETLPDFGLLPSDLETPLKKIAQCIQVNLNRHLPLKRFYGQGTR